MEYHVYEEQAMGHRKERPSRARRAVYTAMAVFALFGACVKVGDAMGSSGGNLAKDAGVAEYSEFDAELSLYGDNSNMIGGGGLYEDAQAIFNKEVVISPISMEDLPGNAIRDLGEFSTWSRGKETKSRLYAVDNLPSTAQVSTPRDKYYVDEANGRAVLNRDTAVRTSKMVEAMKKDLGVEVEARSSFRPQEQQTDLYRNEYGDDNLKKCQTDYKNAIRLAVACPGYSNHQSGAAIDFFLGENYPIDARRYKAADGSRPTPSNPAVAPGSKVWEWLNTHAKEYGLYQQFNEPWHWESLRSTPVVASSNEFASKQQELDKIMNFFEGKGLSTAAAAGIAGNLWQESKFRSNTDERKGTVSDDYIPQAGLGFGLAQWTIDSRQKALVRYAREKGVKTTDFDMQLEFILLEMEKDYKSTLNKLRNEQDARKAARLFHDDYERSADTKAQVEDRRGRPATEFYQQYNSDRNSSEGEAVPEGSSIVSPLSPLPGLFKGLESGDVLVR